MSVGRARQNLCSVTSIESVWHDRLSLCRSPRTAQHL